MKDRWAVREWKIDDLKERWAYRHHPEAQLEALKASLEEFGLVALPIVTTRGEIVAGHARIKALRELGAETLRAVTLDLSPEEAEEMVVADNYVFDRGAYDFSVLAGQIVALGRESLVTAEAKDPDLRRLHQLLAGARSWVRETAGKHAVVPDTKTHTEADVDPAGSDPDSGTEAVAESVERTYTDDSNGSKGRWYRCKECGGEFNVL